MLFWKKNDSYAKSGIFFSSHYTLVKKKGDYYSDSFFSLLEGPKFFRKFETFGTLENPGGLEGMTKGI